MSRAVIIIFALFLVSGCDIFDTRTAKDPDGGGGDGWKFPADPYIPLNNLKSAIGRHSSTDYLRIFVLPGDDLPDFRFIADRQTAAAYPGVFDGWTYSKEQKHAQSVFAQANLPLDSLALLELHFESESRVQDTSRAVYSYQLHLGLRQDGAPRDMSGRADFLIIRARDGGWYVQRWEDSRNSDLPCWSDLKAMY